MNSPNPTLSAKQRLFCEEYVRTYNATQSYLTAYPNAGYDTAKATGWQLLRDQRVKDYITQLEKEVYEANRINYERIANELAKMAFSETSAENIKLRAIDLLQKQLGLQTQKVDATVSNDINIKIE